MHLPQFGGTKKILAWSCLDLASLSRGRILAAFDCSLSAASWQKIACHNRPKMLCRSGGWTPTASMCARWIPSPDMCRLGRQTSSQPTSLATARPPFTLQTATSSQIRVQPTCRSTRWNPYCLSPWCFLDICSHPQAAQMGSTSQGWQPCMWEDAPCFWCWAVSCGHPWGCECLCNGDHFRRWLLCGRQPCVWEQAICFWHGALALIVI